MPPLTLEAARSLIAKSTSTWSGEPGTGVVLVSTLST